MRPRTCAALALACLAPLAAAQEGRLDLSQALRLARIGNGNVRSARLSVEAARANARAANADYFPTVTPTLRQQYGRLEQRTGRFAGGSDLQSRDASLTASWLLLDNGTRRLNVRRSETSRDATFYTALETYRGVLFDVHTTFYNALRTQELLRIQQAGVDRAKKLVERAELREEVGAGPRKDILQAQADLANAQVNELSAASNVTTSEANLKAVIGWPEDDLPPLEKPATSDLTMQDVALGALESEALANRPALIASRKRLENARYNVDAARLNAGVTFSARATYDRSFAEDVADQSLLVLQASLPLFDASRSREEVRSARFTAEAQAADLQQQERDVLADVESAFQDYRLNVPRYEAAQLALRAAQLNYEAASGAFDEGAADLIEVLTAQVSLTTAETNAIQTLYDLLVSEVRLRLVTGRPLPGELDSDE
ncbi:MAG: TolC family protein [Fimbriimonadaceae bacterium]|nr:TolC family protein [Fimbriimonadaceae bacterium]QYK56998.1 MAG: TolC family protein [Fimbriimonadaceae bacterium]